MKIHIIEPNRAVYIELLNLAFEVCRKFLLVKRGDIHYGENTDRILSLLEPSFLEGDSNYYWPGTVGGYADIYYYETNEEALSIIKSNSDSFTSWCAPNLPEDMCFVKDTGDVWLVNVAHEGECWIENPTEQEVKRITGAKDIRYCIQE